MKYDKATGNITTAKGDFGVGLKFTFNGAQVGDKIIFCFGGTIKPGNKVYTLDSTLTCEFFFTKQDAQILTSSHMNNIPYSIKHYRDEVMLNTLVDAQVNIKRTVIANE